MKILGLEFFKPKTPENTASSVSADSATDAQQRVDAMQNSLNTLKQNADMVKEPGVPSVDAPQIADVSAKIEAAGIPPTVPPVEPKAKFAATPSPDALNRISRGQSAEITPTSTMTNEELTAQLPKVEPGAPVQISEAAKNKASGVIVQTPNKKAA